MSEEARSAPPTQVGSYRLLAKIGEGGMGVVHLAEGPDGRRVALKVLRPHIVGDDEARERLAREVASLRRVASPRIAEIIDADPWAEMPFVATRYVPGPTLHEQVRQQGPIPRQDLRRFAAGLAEAVIAVHGVGVLHRDIKPSNVLLEGRAPVLIDFGLARLAEDPRLTATGWLLGTPGYLAPEILYGDDATTASDVHSWAATVAFAATGRPPFGKGPAMAIMDRVRRGEHDLTGVPPDLLGMVEQCLSADPADRPETAALLADLRRSAGTSPPPEDGALTMPFALFTSQDDDGTDVLEPESDQRADAPAAAAGAAVTPTRPLTVRLPPDEPLAQRHQPAREPYRRPPPPRSPHPRPGSPAQQRRQVPAGIARLQRGCALLALFGLVAVGFALAPYLCVVAVALVTLVARTFSWTADSARGRRLRRGRTRWYDGPVAVLTSPWYLVLAAGGTLVLLLGAVALAVAVGTGYLLFSRPGIPGLLLMGAVLGPSLWWGPGSRRLRAPTQQALVRFTRSPAMGWSMAGVLAVAVALCAFALANGGVQWAPQPGPPWRGDTVLDRVVDIF